MTLLVLPPSSLLPSFLLFFLFSFEISFDQLSFFISFLTFLSVFVNQNKSNVDLLFIITDKPSHFRPERVLSEKENPIMLVRIEMFSFPKILYSFSLFWDISQI
jgi:hypothetical protein